MIRILISAFVSIFGLVGIVLLVSFWRPDRGFMQSDLSRSFGIVHGHSSPSGGLPDSSLSGAPAFFKLMGSLVAFGFIIGSAVMLRVIWSRKLKVGPAAMHGSISPAPAEGNSSQQGLDLQCDHCGAGLEVSTEISPSGDVKCSYCKRWFNVRRARPKGHSLS